MDQFSRRSLVFGGLVSAASFFAPRQAGAAMPGTAGLGTLPLPDPRPFTIGPFAIRPDNVLSRGRIFDDAILNVSQDCLKNTEDLSAIIDKCLSHIACVDFARPITNLVRVLDEYGKKRAGLESAETTRLKQALIVTAWVNVAIVYDPKEVTRSNERKSLTKTIHDGNGICAEQALLKYWVMKKLGYEPRNFAFVWEEIVNDGKINTLTINGEKTYIGHAVVALREMHGASGYTTWIMNNTAPPDFPKHYTKAQLDGLIKKICVLENSFAHGNYNGHSIFYPHGIVDGNGAIGVVKDIHYTQPIYRGPKIHVAKDFNVVPLSIGSFSEDQDFARAAHTAIGGALAIHGHKLVAHAPAVAEKRPQRVHQLPTITVTPR